MPCSWLPPSFKSVPFAPIAKIDFPAPDKKMLEITSNSPHGTVAGSSSPKQSAVLTPSSSELDALFKKIAKDKPVVLSLTPGYSAAYVCTSVCARNTSKATHRLL